jgi:hypothetical protein
VIHVCLTYLNGLLIHPLPSLGGRKVVLPPAMRSQDPERRVAASGAVGRAGASTLRALEGHLGVFSGVPLRLWKVGALRWGL